MTSTVESPGAGPTTPSDSDALLKQLQAVVAARVAYWDALAMLENGLSPFAELTDRANDKLVDMVEDLCSGINVPSDAFIKVTHSMLKNIETKLKDLLR